MAILPKILSNLLGTLEQFFRTSGGIEGKEISTPVDQPVSGRRRLYSKSDGWYEQDSSGVETKLGSGSSGTSIRQTYTQASHGFSVGNPVYVNSSGEWRLAKADNTGTSEALGILESVNGNDFTVVFSGEITGDWISSLTIGNVYWISAETAGALVDSAPTYPNVDKPVLVVISASSGIVKDLRGIIDNDDVSIWSDVVGGRLMFTSELEIRWEFTYSNQVRLHTGTTWCIVQAAAEPVAYYGSQDILGDYLANKPYDVFLKYESPTSYSIEFLPWGTGNSTRYSVWTTSTSYVVGTRVSNGGVYYFCIQDHTSGATIQPGFSDDWDLYWVRLEGSGDTYCLGICDGVPVMANNGDFRRYRYVGIVVPFADTGLVRFKWEDHRKSIGNYYNQRQLKIYKSAAGAGGAFSNKTFSLWTNWTSPGMQAVFATSQVIEAVCLWALIVPDTDPGDFVYSAIRVDGNNGYLIGWQSRRAPYWEPMTSDLASDFISTIGLHYFDLGRWCVYGSDYSYVHNDYDANIHIFYWG